MQLIKRQIEDWVFNKLMSRNVRVIHLVLTNGVDEKNVTEVISSECDESVKYGKFLTEILQREENKSYYLK